MLAAGEASKRWRLKHPKYARDYARKRREDPANRDKDRAAAARYRARNPEKVRESTKQSHAKTKRERPKTPLQHWHEWLWRKYRMRPAQYGDMLVKQNGVCAFCLGGNSDGRRLYVDHDHNKPKGEGNRWLLCGHCNFMIGHAKEQSGLLRRAADKLDEYYGL